MDSPLPPFEKFINCGKAIALGSFKPDEQLVYCSKMITIGCESSSVKSIFNWIACIIAIKE
jgi:hypothetical protein